MNEDQLIIGDTADKIAQCRDNYMPTNSNFLDMHQQSVALAQVKKEKPERDGVRVIFSGGYEGAERVVMFCLPDYMEIEAALDDTLAVVRATHSAGSSASRSGRPLSHGDYLGALIGLGIKREMTGDILVRDDGADIILLKSIAEFVEQNFVKAGKSYLHAEVRPLSDLLIPKADAEEGHTTVASLRLDAIVSSAFRLSRTRAAEAIKGGLVFVNHSEVLKVDAPVEEGDEINLRHKGKIRVTEVGGETRKGRISVNYLRFGNGK